MSTMPSGITREDALVLGQRTARGSLREQGHPHAVATLTTRQGRAYGSPSPRSVSLTAPVCSVSVALNTTTPPAGQQVVQLHYPEALADQPGLDLGVVGHEVGPGDAVTVEALGTHPLAYLADDDVAELVLIAGRGPARTPPLLAA